MNLGNIFQSSRKNGSIVHYYRGGRLACRMSGEEIFQKSTILAEKIMEDFSLKRGDRVCIVMENSVEFLCAIQAVVRLGLVAVPLNPDESAYYFEFVLNDIGAALVLSSRDYKQKAGFGNIPVLSFSLDDLEQENSSSAIDCSVDETDIAVIFFTSGTTSISKGVCLSHGQILSNLRATARCLELNSSTVHYCVLPLFHVNAFNFSFLASFLVGARLVLDYRFFQPTFWLNVRSEGVNVISLVPSLVRLLISDPREFRDYAAGLRFAISAAAPLTRSDVFGFLEKFGVPLIQGYGLSEAVNFSLMGDPELSLEKYKHIMSFEENPPVGFPHTFNEVRIVGRSPQPNKEADLRFLGEREVGELFIAGTNLMTGYWGRTQETMGIRKGDWMATGDLGYFVNYEGRRLFFLVGRKKDIIIRAGKNISPFELELVFSRDKCLSDGVVVGFSNKWVGEEVGIYFESSKSETDIALIHKRLIENFPFFKRPKVVICGPSIPRTSTGKIKRKELAGFFAQYEQSIFLDKKS